MCIQIKKSSTEPLNTETFLNKCLRLDLTTHRIYLWKTVTVSYLTDSVISGVCYPTCRQNICWLIKEWQLLTVCVAQIFCILWDCTVITYFHLPSCTFSTHSDISCSPVIAVLKVLDVCVKVRDRDKAERNWTRGNLIVATLKSFSKIVLAMLCSDEGISEHFVI